METVTLKLPSDLLRDAARLAHSDAVTVGHLVRVLLAKEIARRAHKVPSEPTDQGLLAALQALLARDIAEALDWSDLAARLAFHGYEFRAAGGGVVLHKSSCGTRLCKGSELGFSYRALVERFGGPMPGHPKGAMGVVPDAAPMESAALGRLQRTLKPVFEHAADWESLVASLKRRGYALRLRGADLGLFAMPQGRHLCASDA